MNSEDTPPDSGTASSEIIDPNVEETSGELRVYAEAYSGPLPHGRIAAEWERILPGSADRILTMSEKQQNHRIEMDKAQQRNAAEANQAIIKAFAERDRQGRWFALIALLALIGLCFHAMSLGYSLESVALIGTALATLAGAFIYSHRSSRNELREKREALQKPASPPELSAGGQPRKPAS